MTELWAKSVLYGNRQQNQEFIMKCEFGIGQMIGIDIRIKGHLDKLQKLTICIISLKENVTNRLIWMWLNPFDLWQM